MIDNGANVIVNPGIQWSKEKPVLKEGVVTTFDVRQIDVAGNVSVQTVNLILDSIKPVGKPTIAPAVVDDSTMPPVIGGESEIDGDAPSSSSGGVPVTFGPVTSSPTVTNPNTVNLTISGLDQDINVGWEYSTDKGNSWTFGGRNDTSGSASLSLAKPTTGPVEVVVRQLDAAGNVSEASLPYTIDVPAAQPTFDFFTGMGVLIISGTATDDVLVDFTALTVTRNGAVAESYGSEVVRVLVNDYAGAVKVQGTVGKITATKANFEADGVDSYGLVDAKARFFSGEPGKRAFTSEAVETLVVGAKSVQLTDTLSAEENNLFKTLAGFDSKLLSATLDLTPPGALTVALETDSGFGQAAAVDKVTNHGTLKVFDQEASATVQFSTDGDDWSTTQPVAKFGENTVFVRQIDDAGNIGESVSFTFEFDNVDPGQPKLELVNDTDLPDMQTTVGEVRVLDLEEFGSFEYRTDPESNWIPGTPIIEGSAVVTLSGEGEKYIEVRQFDRAGNESVTDFLIFTLLAQQPDSDEGTAPNTGTSDPSDSDTPDADPDDSGIEIVGSTPEPLQP